MVIFSVVAWVNFGDVVKYVINGTTEVLASDFQSYLNTGSPANDVNISLRAWLNAGNEPAMYTDPSSSGGLPTPPGSGSGGGGGSSGGNLYLPDMPEATAPDAVTAGKVMVNATTSDTNIGDTSAKLVDMALVKIRTAYSAGTLDFVGRTIDLTDYAAGDVIAFMPMDEFNQVSLNFTGAAGGSLTALIGYV